MAAHQQTRIQAYLEKNRIGPLFEELMTKLITETPDQPIPFLIDHLQSKQGNRSQLQRTLSGSAALWAESETSENKGTRRDCRSYDKPWQVNAKKPKKSKSDLAVSNISPPSPESKSLPRSIEHPKWDWRRKPESQEFDELNHILQESKKLGKALENLSRKDLDDLRMEGVTSVMTSGSKFNQTRSTHPAEPQAKVTLNICARCARLQGDNLAETAEDVSLVSQTTEQAASDSNASVPGVETLMEDADEFESASQITGPHQPVWDLDVMCARNGGSPSQKLLKDSLAAKELQTMEKHLADIEKDLALWEEASSSPHINLVTSHQPGNLQATLGQNSRSQVPSQTGKNIQLQLQENKSPLPTNSRAQVSSTSSSRPQTSNMQNNRPPTPSTPGSRPATPNSLLPRPHTSSNQGNKDGILSMQRSRSLTSKSQIGRTLGTPAGLSVQTSGDIIGTVPQRISLSEDEFLHQFQLAHQPWILPSDTESEGVEADQDKCMNLRQNQSLLPL
ncbi:uncharacterized protein C8orf34 homolog isoform X6 [Malaclemys terrapin pileata]|uniref:uncharacterized protein C8orf34 homolog isoform X6 n=1 Tax=Malaclemys terrapin pileata TaxID=2991368 RepID=UPI0023A7F0DD|nr:uncharacterized protein C8orf34 homolog isoform X6 [Malaclemys terrapin pileata]